MELVDIWNNWIVICKQQISYDLARSFLFALINYSIIGLGGHYVFGFDAEYSHYSGILFAFLNFGLVAYVYGKKNGWLKDVFEDLDKEVK